jgi:ESS family glutamate:Na+ symporter
MSLPPVTTLLAAFVVLLIGTLLNRRIAVLAKYNIPDPITGGLLFAILGSAAWVGTGFVVTIDQGIKPLLLLMFFAGVGMCADLRMLKAGGRALMLFLLVLFPYILVQNCVGIVVAKALDLHPIFGLVAGSITLVGGHGTGAAYAERFSEVYNLRAVMDLSMTLATVGLIVGGLIGGPVAEYLIERGNLRPNAAADVRAGAEKQDSSFPPITTVGMIMSLTGIFAAVIAGQWAASQMPSGSITIPGFLWCMIFGIAIRNLGPFVGLRFDDRASELIAGVSLSLFLVMTMMALNLAAVFRSAGPFLLIVAVQVVFIVLYSVFVSFRLMGRDYEAAVTTAAFIGFNMGSTATAMANMQAITAKYGPAPKSLLIVPLSGAFFVDLMNAFILTFLLALPLVGG